MPLNRSFAENGKVEVVGLHSDSVVSTVVDDVAGSNLLVILIPVYA
jgi:hypothetical protein